MKGVFTCIQICATILVFLFANHFEKPLNLRNFSTLKKGVEEEKKRRGSLFRAVLFDVCHPPWGPVFCPQKEGRRASAGSCDAPVGRPPRPGGPCLPTPPPGCVCPRPTHRPSFSRRNSATPNLLFTCCHRGPLLFSSLHRPTSLSSSAPGPSSFCLPHTTMGLFSNHAEQSTFAPAAPSYYSTVSENGVAAPEVRCPDQPISPNAVCIRPRCQAAACGSLLWGPGLSRKVFQTPRPTGARRD